MYVGAGEKERRESSHVIHNSTEANLSLDLLTLRQRQRQYPSIYTSTTRDEHYLNGLEYTGKAQSCGAIEYKQCRGSKMASVATQQPSKAHQPKAPANTIKVGHTYH